MFSHQDAYSTKNDQQMKVEIPSENSEERKKIFYFSIFTINSHQDGYFLSIYNKISCKNLF